MVTEIFRAYVRSYKSLPLTLIHIIIFSADTAESHVYCHRDLIDMPVTGEDIDFDGDLDSIVRARSNLYAATEDVHNQAEFEEQVPADKRVSARGIEVGQIFY